MAYQRTVSILLALSCAAPQSNTRQEQKAPRSCPLETKQDPTREEKIKGLLRERSAEALFCFGELWPSRVVTDGTYLLDKSATDEELAARVAHLAKHQERATLFDTPPADKAKCEAWVSSLLVEESKAYAIELRLRRELGVTSNPYAFEEEFWRSAPEQREGLIFQYLREHPEGGGGIDALGAGYKRRCLGGDNGNTPR